jgi:hypothetical protein
LWDCPPLWKTFEEKIDERLINIIRNDDSKSSSSDSEDEKINPLQLLGNLIIAYESSREKNE